MGITIFRSVPEAIRAGYEILSPIPDSEGNLHARTRIDSSHYALALVIMK